MKIERKELLSQLLAFATEGNGLIVGSPGVGKSFAIAELRDALKAKQIPHLILSVERLGTATEPELKAVLKREGDFVHLLKAAVSKTNPPAILIFDGFDAAR